MTIPRIVSYALVVALLVGIMSMPYAYYEILRCGVSIVAGMKAYDGFKLKRILPVIVFGILAIFFNPVIPIHIPRDNWPPIDLIAAGIFLAEALVSFTRERKSRKQ